MTWMRNVEGGRSWYESRYKGFQLEAYNDAWRAYIGPLSVAGNPASSVQQAKKQAIAFADAISIAAFGILGRHVLEHA